MRTVWIVLAVFFLLFVCNVHAVRPENISEGDYIDAYFSVYKSYISGNDNSEEELNDIIEYYLMGDSLGENLNYVGTKSKKMIGSILADAGTYFDCGVCNASSIGRRCCIYRVGGVPLAYDCVGEEVVGVSSYTWKEIWQCVYGCCKNNCCRSVDDTSTTWIVTTTVPLSTTTAPVTTVPISTTSTQVTTTLPTTTSSSKATTTSLSGWGEICVDCCMIGQGNCIMVCGGGVSQSSGSPITECIYDGSMVSLKRGTSVSITVSCRNGKCAGGQPTTSLPTTTTQHIMTTTTTLATITTTLASTTTLVVTTTTKATTTTTQPAVKMTIIFVPVDWDQGMQAFNSLADQQTAILLGQIPLKSCPSKLKTIKLSQNCVLNVPYDFNSCYANSNAILAGIENCAKSSGEKYDYVAGFSPEQRCGQRGFSSGGSGIIYLAGPQRVALTHELGHEWELDDEYYNSCRCWQWSNGFNCLDASIGGSDPGPGYSSSYCASGSLCPSNFDTSCLGNKNPVSARCIMGDYYITPAASDGFCLHCMNHLAKFDFLKC